MSGSTSIVVSSQSAYFRRSARSAARVPLTTTASKRPAATSKSASQTQETSRPSAMPSFRARSAVLRPGSRSSVCSTWLRPAGFLARKSSTRRPSTSNASWRPKAAAAAARASVTGACGRPRAQAAAVLQVDLAGRDLGLRPGAAAGRAAPATNVAEVDRVVLQAGAADAAQRVAGVLQVAAVQLLVVDAEVGHVVAPFARRGDGRVVGVEDEGRALP